MFIEQARIRHVPGVYLPGTHAYPGLLHSWLAEYLLKNFSYMFIEQARIRHVPGVYLPGTHAYPGLLHSWLAEYLRH